MKEISPKKLADKTGIKKYKELRKLFKNYDQEDKYYSKYEQKELSYDIGDVVGIHDASVPFDWNRRIENIKDKLRPCLIIDKNIKFYYYTVVPGTSKEHKDTPEAKVIVAHVPPEELVKTTYFLYQYRWNVNKKIIQKRLAKLYHTHIPTINELIWKN